MGWYPSIVDAELNVLVLPRPVSKFGFSGGNAITTVTIPLQAGTIAASVKRTAGTLSIEGVITCSPYTAFTTASDLYTAASDLKTFLTALNGVYRVYLYRYGYGVGSVSGSLFCEKCRCTSVSVADSITGNLVLPYSISFTVPDGLLRYETP